MGKIMEISRQVVSVKNRSLFITLPAVIPTAVYNNSLLDFC
jgi:hypothetical protein